jgi:hypothetical protein
MIIKAPNTLPLQRVNGVVPHSVFLAGSIEMGAAEDWQTRVGKAREDKGYIIFNPRRDDWDSSWKQEIEDGQFYNQVSWELNALDIAEEIRMYFDPATKSPISLLELGLYASSKKIIVGCPDGFYRKGNVQIVCQRYNIPFFTGEKESVIKNMMSYSIIYGED